MRIASAMLQVYAGSAACQMPGPRTRSLPWLCSLRARFHTLVARWRDAELPSTSRIYCDRWKMSDDADPTPGPRASPLRHLHHVTATVDRDQPDLDFFTGRLGLRLVKRTVNFDNHNVHHFYYGT